MADIRVVLAVAVGGVVGALGRHAVTGLVPSIPGTFDWIVLAINVTGSALLGALAGLSATHRFRHPLARPFLGVGVLGGFTTFSTFALDASQLAAAGQMLAALAYVGLTTLGCLAAALVGIRSVTR